MATAHAHDLIGKPEPTCEGCRGTGFLPIRNRAGERVECHCRAWCKQHDAMCGLNDDGPEQVWHDDLCDCARPWGLCPDVAVDAGGAYYTDLHYEEPRTT